MNKSLIIIAILLSLAACKKPDYVNNQQRHDDPSADMHDTSTSTSSSSDTSNDGDKERQLWAFTDGWSDQDERWSHFAPPEDIDKGDLPNGRWKDDRTGCWYIVADTHALTPEIQSNGMPLCDTPVTTN